MRDTNGRFWPFADHQLTPIPLSELFFPTHPLTPKTHPHLFFNMPMDFQFYSLLHWFYQLFVTVHSALIINPLVCDVLQLGLSALILQQKHMLVHMICSLFFSFLIFFSYLPPVTFGVHASPVHLVYIWCTYLLTLHPVCDQCWRKLVCAEWVEHHVFVFFQNPPIHA